MIMFYAHLLPFYIENSTILPFERIICSTAAPIFLFLLGYNFNEKTSFKKTLIRGIVLLLIGVFIDVFIFSINPFFSFDVLYLIGFSLLILGLMENISFRIRMYFLLFLVTVTVLFHFFGFYQFDISEPHLGDKFDFQQSLLNFFFNGWFPLFPWLIFPIFGNVIRKLDKMKSFNYMWFVVLIIISWIYFIFNLPEIRSFSIEIFYPAGLPYLIFGFSIIVIIWNKRFVLEGKMLIFFSELGRVSLFLYVYHLSIYQVLFSYLPLHNVHRLFVFCIFSLQFLVFAYFLNWIKKRWPQYGNFEVLTIILGK